MHAVSSDDDVRQLTTSDSGETPDPVPGTPLHQMARIGYTLRSRLNIHHSDQTHPKAGEHQVATRILSISGLRGIIGDGLDPIYVSKFAAALGTIFCGGKVVVARDGRSTGPMIHHAVVSGCLRRAARCSMRMFVRRRPAECSSSTSSCRRCKHGQSQSN